MYGRNILVAKSPVTVEDCLQLSFRNVTYQTLAYLLYSF